MSDHVPILFEVCQTKADPKGSDPGAVPVKGWIWEKNSEEKFAKGRRAKVAGRNELSAEVLGMAITEACDGSLRRRQRKGTRPRYWWTTEVAERRRECVRARRILSRQARRGHIDPTEKENLQAIYQEARKDLKREIKAAKAKAFEKIRQEVEEDVWGKGYKIVMRKMVATIPPTESEEKAAVSTLFPQAPVNKWRKMGGEDGPKLLGRGTDRGGEENPRREGCRSGWNRAGDSKGGIECGPAGCPRRNERPPASERIPRGMEESQARTDTER
jgi:hypothetical protein